MAHARSQIDQLKKAGVPKLMQEKNVEALEKILESFDYSAYKDYEEPKFELQELHLDGEEDIYAIVFYIWGNPHIEYGDFDFFREYNDFANLMKNQQDSYLSKTLYNILYEKGCILSRDCDYFKSITIQQLLGLEEVT